MALVYESPFYIAETPDFVSNDRDDGGHIEISPKTKLVNRQALTPKQAIELMRLTSVVGQALATAMNGRGVDIGRINYQDNGNWDIFSKDGPYLHVHVFGRAKSAKVNKYGHALHFPHMDEDPEHYKTFKPLNAEDIQAVRQEIEQLFEALEYQNAAWGL